MALFWHHVFATGNSKVDNYDQLLEQIDLFRKHGMGNYRDLLLTIAKNPTMIFWLDNNQNHGTAVNENWGRELLELFSLGAGNYTEVDVREASRAFTGWTFETKMPRLPYGRFPWKFEYRAEDHDDGEKTFLGHKGNLNGEDIIDIIVQQPACAKFICRHLYNFFVADEPQVPAWSIEQPRDPAAIATLMKVFQESKCEITPVLRALFTSDFFKNARYQHLKSPAEVVVGTLRLVGGYETAEAGLRRAVDAAVLHGPGPAEPAVGRRLAHRQGVDQQRLVDVAHQLRRRADRQPRPAGRAGDHRPPEGAGHPDSRSNWSTNCLDLLGPVEVGADTKKELTDAAKQWGEISWDTPANEQAATQHTGEMLQLIVATREYQFALTQDPERVRRNYNMSATQKDPVLVVSAAHGRQRLPEHGDPVQQPLYQDNRKAVGIGDSDMIAARPGRTPSRRTWRR